MLYNNVRNFNKFDIFISLFSHSFKFIQRLGPDLSVFQNTKKDLYPVNFLTTKPTIWNPAPQSAPFPIYFPLNTRFF